MIASLCRTCRHCRDVVSARGSRFFLCRLSQHDSRYPKYPPQPVVRCHGYCKIDNESDQNSSQASPSHSDRIQ